MQSRNVEIIFSSGLLYTDNIKLGYAMQVDRNLHMKLIYG